MRTELKPVYDIRNSFYKKAYVESYDSFIVLESYGSIVAVINSNGTAELTEHWNYSRTTARHLAEFLRQHGFDSSEVGIPALRKALKRKNVYGNVLITTVSAVESRVLYANIGRLQTLSAAA